ncbi:hypothetical protein GCM10025864_36010 [Luteimicrobium album]|uniref:Uncharacterized protein n=1 Tax=Luteimicrobium album TaxID=1054550 RepID=A0ABQ6I5C4_9MICO|nr:hypothetical protein GCM10025864_36010 [Luteimicrobium album]
MAAAGSSASSGRTAHAAPADKATTATTPVTRTSRRRLAPMSRLPPLPCSDTAKEFCQASHSAYLGNGGQTLDLGVLRVTEDLSI